MLRESLSSVRPLSRIAALLALLCVAAADPPTPATIAALPAEAVAGAGANLPFVEHEAENATTNGRIVGPDRHFTGLAAEASGRRAVRLAGAGRFVEFVLSRPANAITVRAAIPDTPDGVAPPPEQDYDTAEMTPMARSFYGENKRVSNARIKRELEFAFNYPTYREGLAALAQAEGLPTAAEAG